MADTDITTNRNLYSRLMVGQGNTLVTLSVIEALDMDGGVDSANSICLDVHPRILVMKGLYNILIQGHTRILGTACLCSKHIEYLRLQSYFLYLIHDGINQLKVVDSVHWQTSVKLSVGLSQLLQCDVLGLELFPALEVVWVINGWCIGNLLYYLCWLGCCHNSTY